MRGSIYGYVVRGDTGRPVAGARVSMAGDKACARHVAPQHTRSTNSAGWFTFDLLPSGLWHVIAIGPAGGRGEARVTVFDNATTEVTISLNGLQRWLACTLAPAARADDLADARSDQDNADVGQLTRADKMKDQQHSSSRQEPVRTGSVRGRVVRGSGHPVADATIGIIRGAGPAPDIAPITDAEGHFAMDELPWGDWELSATDPAGQRGRAEVRVWGDEAIFVQIWIGPE